MKTIAGSRWTLAAAALLALAGSALAGDAVKIAIEPPQGVVATEAGDPVDVQIVGLDAAGNRVGFGDRKVETSATEGDLTLVEAPYKYRYTPPASADQPMTVQLSAWLKQAPDVQGRLSLQILPKRPFVRLILQGATGLELGKTADIEILGVRADGTTVPAKDTKVLVTVTSGPGTVELVGKGMWRYTAPAKTETKAIGKTALLKAQLEAYPRVVGELAIVLTPEAPPGAPGGGGVTPPVPVPVPGTQTPPTPQPPTLPKPPAVPSLEDEGGLAWPSGNVKVLVWRTKAAKADEYPAKKRNDMPAAGRPFVARDPFHLLRIEIERNDVRKVELESYVGDKKGAPVHIDDADKDGRLRTEINKAGKKCAIIECETPEEKPLILNLLLTTASGEVIKEEFVVQRGRDRNDDGSKDRPKKK